MTAAQPLTIERVFASPGLSGAVPRGVKLSPDGRWLTLLRGRPDDRERYDLWGFDRTTGKWAMLVDSLKLGSGKDLSEAEKMQRERQRIGDLKGIVSYEWAVDSLAILVPLDGDLFLARLDGSVQRLSDTSEDELNPALSPKGAYVSFVRGRRLWTGKVGEAAQPVTPQEQAETVSWGEAEFVAQEEMDRHTGYWWSPDDSRVAVQRFDEAPVAVVTRAAIGAEGTKTYAQRYPLAGTPNALVSLFVQKPDGSQRVEVELGPDSDIYLARVDWAPDGKTLYVQREDRGQTKLDMLAVDPATGKSRVLFTETAAKGHWIDLSHSYRFLKDGSLVWMSPLAQAIVDKGYVYFQIDNRGVDFSKQIFRAMGSVEVADQLAGAEYLKSLPFVDGAKIATYGWSYGGYMTLKMLQANPGVYAAGIAGAPVTKWELYDTHYTERYMGDPKADAAAYAKANAMADTARIEDPLLLVHGMADDNVVFENSSALIAKMQGEVVPFEMMLYPGYTHRVGGPKVGPHLWNSIFAFLERHGVKP